MQSMALEDVGDKDVIIKWPKDSLINSASILDADGNVVLTQAVTAEEQAAGRKKISGLTPETNYVAKIFYNGKERGSRKFTTIVDLSGATIVRSTDDFSSMLENATEGQVFALYNGTYMISSGGLKRPTRLVLLSSSTLSPSRASTPPPNRRFRVHSRCRTVLRSR